MKQLPWVFIAAFFLNGCSGTFTLNPQKTDLKEKMISYQEFNTKIAPQAVKIVLRDQKIYKAKRLFLSDDSLSFTVDDTLHKMKQNDVQYIKNTYYTFGAVGGSFGGALVGCAGGAIIGSHGDNDPWGGFAGGLIGTPIGALCGLVLGVVYPPETTYIFETLQKQTSSKELQ